MNEERVKYLLQQFKGQQLTAAEEQELQSLFNNEASAELIRNTLEAMMHKISGLEATTTEPNWEAISEKILATDRPTGSLQSTAVAHLPTGDQYPVASGDTAFAGGGQITAIRGDASDGSSLSENNRHNNKFRRLFIRAVAAAALLACITATSRLLLRPNEKTPAKTIATKNQQPSAITPGMNGAILTLDDHSQVLLDSAGNGWTAEQQGATVLLKNGALVYDEKETKEVAYNRMSTPRGRQFHLTLSDGTRVWLNAASSIRYPTRFSEKNRKVEITGEVYFEVAKQANSPFIVSMRNGNSVEVLGTSFNINSYEDESQIRATLLEGSVRVAYGDQYSMILQPGQQAEMNYSGIRVNTANTSKVMAWKNGVFDFENAGLDEVMRQLSRWYDVEVIYEKGIVPDIKFGGKMNRNMQFDNMLKALEMSKVNVRLEGRKLIILPK